MLGKRTLGGAKKWTDLHCFGETQPISSLIGHLSFPSQVLNEFPPGSTCFSPPATTSICSSRLLAIGCTRGLMTGRPSWKARGLAEAWRVLSKASKEQVWLPEGCLLELLARRRRRRYLLPSLGLGWHVRRKSCGLKWQPVLAAKGRPLVSTGVVSWPSRPTMLEASH